MAGRRHQCEAGLFDRCRSWETKKCSCCGLWLCERHMHMGRSRSARRNYLQAFGIGLGVAKAAPGAVKEYRKAYTPAREGLKKFADQAKKGEYRAAATTYMKESAKVGTGVIKAHGRVAGKVLMLTDEAQEAQKLLDDARDLERKTRPGKKKKKGKKNPRVKLAWKRAVAYGGHFSWTTNHAGWRYRLTMMDRAAPAPPGYLFVLAKGDEQFLGTKHFPPAKTQKTYQKRVRDAKKWAETQILDPLVVLAEEGRRMKKNPTKQELRNTYKTIRESYYCYGSPKHPPQDFDAVIKLRAHAVPGGPSSLDPWAWIALAKELHDDQRAKWERDRTTVECHRCAGTGQFITGMHNGKPTGPGGSCFRCGGKGRQNAEDMRRNCYYDIKGIPPGNLY